ncbi:asparaginase [Maribacter sp. 2307ULW6-5]|uniref:asparaginase n=1 Tax=Maribacter sp. 2307ULW6-5 TaxID=3386275 RepID=UPI0039BD2689
MKTGNSNILIIYTGGTIGMVKDYASGALKAFDFKGLLESIPELHQLECQIDATSFEVPLDSSNMHPEDWVRLATMIEQGYDHYDGFVVLHGSDTMSYTASALSFLLENLQKPVIITGSQLPIGDLRTDAKENLITAVQIAALKNENGPVVREVGLYFEYKLYRGNRTTKINAEHFEAFASLNHPHLVESGVHLKVFSQFLWAPKKRKPLVVHKKLNTNVAVLKLFPGIGEQVLRGVLSSKGLKALVLETYGSGNAPSDSWFVEVLREAISNGIHIVNVTQCSGGSVMMGQYETSTQLQQLQLISGKDITTEAAVAKLMYMLGAEVHPRHFKTVFETSLRGEMHQN